MSQLNPHPTPSPQLRSIFDLGVDEAHNLLTHRFAQTDLPPLEAIENEDWGRDSLLTRLHALPDEALATAGLTRDDVNIV